MAVQRLDCTTESMAVLSKMVELTSLLVFSSTAPLSMRRRISSSIYAQGFLIQRAVPERQRQFGLYRNSCVVILLLRCEAFSHPECCTVSRNCRL